ncbi:hypothetical protein [Candidatus Xianfuyuplasma coldseepsis]|uniref:Uncharacterized protein n=1 Tax=Candidatus Xianfuyuplasma coldseepsis TaxID=2782163 RepID=A0A7L7KPH5_9MOLU|nr:hypothetical protein [Xianfuyuplasma coldseepsis]QMS84603.1 hypothetical protein G4Z02_02165 [Xianfuyuplasma coldseepsis]
MTTKMTAFWNYFTLMEEEIYHNLESQPEEYSLLIHEELLKVDEGLVFDIPFEQVDGQYELIISADGDMSLFETVFTLCNLAPSYERWRIVPLRPRTNQADQAIDLDNLYLEYEDIYYTIQNDEFPLQLEIYINGYTKDDNRYVHGYFLLLDTLLGEYDAVVNTETVQVEPYNDQESVKRFILLRDEFDQYAQKKNN